MFHISLALHMLIIIDYCLNFNSQSTIVPISLTITQSQELVLPMSRSR